MKLIVGLGNPGEKYRQNRHNAGFSALDFILNDDGFMAAKPSHEFKSDMFTWTDGKEKVIFLKPQTFMNDSGLALIAVCSFYKLDPASDLLIVHDEVDLPFGAIKPAFNSSAAGHKGVQNIIDNLGTQNFSRLRIGVETRASREQLPTDAFVLQNFTDEETKKLQEEIFPKVDFEVKKFLGILS